MRERLIVLGANGFIGREIVRQATDLLGADAVVAGVRRATQLLPASIEQRMFDAETPTSIPAICHDTRYVINCVMGSESAMNGSCQGAIAAVAGRSERRLIHLSSIAVFGSSSMGSITEDAPCGPPADSYAAAKIEAENLLVRSPDTGWTILRPGLVHGPGSALWTLRIARLVAARRFGPMGRRGETPCNLVSVGDVAAAALSACTSFVAKGRAITLVADNPPSWNAYLEAMAEALRVTPTRISPARLTAERALAYPLAAFSRLGVPTIEAITPGLARLLHQDVRFSSSAVPLLLPAWQDYKSVLAEGARWARAQMDAVRKG